MTEADGNPTAGDPRAGAALHGVLVTYRRPAALAEMLDRLGDQRRRLDTLVVVDNDLDESARAAVAAFAGSTTAPAPGRLPAGGRQHRSRRRHRARDAVGARPRDRRRLGRVARRRRPAPLGRRVRRARAPRSRAAGGRRAGRRHRDRGRALLARPGAGRPGARRGARRGGAVPLDRREPVPVLRGRRAARGRGVRRAAVLRLRRPRLRPPPRRRRLRRVRRRRAVASGAHPHRAPRRDA